MQPCVKKLKSTHNQRLTIDLGDQVVKTSAGSSFHFPIDPFSKTCLLEGIDELGYLLKLDPQISSFEQKAGAG